jgi:hypothetical protein
VDAYVDWHITLAGAAPDDPLMQQASRFAGAPGRAMMRAGGVTPPTAAPGGVGGVGGPISAAAAESGSEASQGLPPVPAPPRAPGRGHV